MNANKFKGCTKFLFWNLQVEQWMKLMESQEHLEEFGF